MEPVFRELFSVYGLDAGRCRVRALGRGHIHDTYLVSECSDHYPPVVLQRINDAVFKNVDLLMRNMELVTAHIADKHRRAGEDPARRGIVLLETEDRESWIKLGKEGSWRMFWFIEGQVSYDTAETTGIAMQGGQCIAQFQHMLSDLDPSLVGASIPDFHDLGMRLKAFRRALGKAGADRLNKASHLADRVHAYEAMALEPYHQSAEGGVPLRITHNDTKFNNILFNKDGRANCMIDLDTVMPGYAWFDFGDALRTCASLSPEDEEDVEKIDFRMDIYSAFAKGYLEVARDFLSPDEIALLADAPLVFTFMQAVRFLTDYLAGDPYYKVSYPDHNYTRARAQLALFESMLEKRSQMHAVIDKLR